jgi:G3E family GTPase
VFELSNGCICCTLSEDFFATLRELMQHRDKFDYLLIETTGIADPDSIVAALCLSEQIKKQFRLDSVICLVDALNFESVLEEKLEVRKQLAVADTVLLNKIDAVSPQYTQELIKLITYLNPLAKVHATSFSQIDNMNLLENYSFSGQSVQDKTMSFGRLTLSKQQTEESSLILKPQTRKLQHELKTESFVIPGKLRQGAFGLWMDNYLFFNSKNIYRIKGIVSLEDMDERLIFQAVKSQYLTELGDAWGEEQRFTKLIFIGRNLKRDEIEDNLYQLLP